MPQFVVTQFAGALFGRYVMARIFTLSVGGITHWSFLLPVALTVMMFATGVNSWPQPCINCLTKFFNNR